MSMNSRRFISMVILFVMVLNIITPNIIQAEPEKRYLTFIDYIKEIERNSGKEWKRPTPKITATTPTGETVTEDGSTIPEDGSPYFTDRLYVPDPILTVPRGTVINLDPNKSELGSGWAIDKYDWQIFPPIDPKNGFEYIKDSKLADTKTTSFVADEPGLWRVYLNVADNYKVVYSNGYASALENWSDKGNWTDITTGIDDPNRRKIGDTGIYLTSWHHTLMTIEVDPAIDIKTEQVITTPQTVTGNKVRVETVYSINDVKSEKDKEKFLHMDYDVVVKSDLFGEKKYS